jgi:subtilisin
MNNLYAFLRSRKFLSVVLSLLALIFPGCHQNDAPTPDLNPNDCMSSSASIAPQPVEGKYIVAFTNPKGSSGRTTAKAARVLERHHLSEDYVTDRIAGELINYIMQLTPEEAALLKRDTAVAHVEQDKILAICSCFTVIEPSLVTWNVDKVGYGDGVGKTAWIMDTGIDMNHPDLTVDQPRSRSFVEGVTSADDDNGHGTHVAGIVGAKNNSLGTLGVASGATLVSLKILDKDGKGFLSTALKALSYVRANGKAGEAVNISLGLEEVSQILETEIKGIANRGIFIAIAAGNDGGPADNYSPARTTGNNIYTVSAIDSLNRFAAFSNYGNDAVDFAAPGVRIVSSYFHNQYAIISGTSMASPHVAGLLLITGGKIKTEGYAIDDPDGTPDPIAHK